MTDFNPGESMYALFGRETTTNWSQQVPTGTSAPMACPGQLQFPGRIFVTFFNEPGVREMQECGAPFAMPSGWGSHKEKPPGCPH